VSEADFPITKFSSISIGRVRNDIEVFDVCITQRLQGCSGQYRFYEHWRFQLTQVEVRMNGQLMYNKNMKFDFTLNAKGSIKDYNKRLTFRDDDVQSNSNFKSAFKENDKACSNPAVLAPPVADPGGFPEL
jgi:hypothetical protein